MANKNSSTSSGLGIAGVLTIVFITLKMLGTISWSWWWVVSPLWIEAGIVIALLVVALVVMVVLEALS